MPQQSLIDYKIIILGFSGVGKTTFIEKLSQCGIEGQQHERYKDLYNIKLLSDNHLCWIEISDPGTEKTGLRLMAMKKAEAAFLMYSTANIQSFHYLSGVVNEIPKREGIIDIPVILIGNKWDNSKTKGEDKKQLKSDQGKKLAEYIGINCHYVQTSIINRRHKQIALLHHLIKEINKKNPQKLLCDKSNTHSSKSCTIL